MSILKQLDEYVLKSAQSNGDSRVSDNAIVLKSWGV